MIPWIKKVIPIVCMLLLAGGLTKLHAQNDTVLTRLNKHDVAMKMVTSFWDADTVAKTQKKSRPKIITKSRTFHGIIGEDRYLKKKEADKRYSEFQVFDIKGLNRDQIAFGLLTNTLDRDTRYDKKDDLDGKLHVATGFLGELDNGKLKEVHSGNSKVPVSAIRFRDKYFLIIGNNDYRYVDGKKLIGGQKVIDELMKGKPISEMTFFYELQQDGIISKNITASQFTKLSVRQKQKMLNNGTATVAGIL